MSVSPAKLIFRNRWKKEALQLADNGLQYVPKDPTDELCVCFDGPEGSPYEGGRFRLRIVLGQYPLSAPSVRMDTRCYNPFISRDGRICCSLLVCALLLSLSLDAFSLVCVRRVKQTEWKPRTTLLMIVMGVKQLLADPSGDNPLEPEIYRELVGNRALFEKRARAETAQFACAAPVPVPAASAPASAPALKRPRTEAL